MEHSKPNNEEEQCYQMHNWKQTKIQVLNDIQQQLKFTFVTH